MTEKLKVNKTTGANLIDWFDLNEEILFHFIFLDVELVNMGQDWSYFYITAIIGSSL